jgi:hypothetical protein
LRAAADLVIAPLHDREHRYAARRRLALERKVPRQARRERPPPFLLALDEPCAAYPRTADAVAVCLDRQATVQFVRSLAQSGCANVTFGGRVRVRATASRLIHPSAVSISARTPRSVPSCRPGPSPVRALPPPPGALVVRTVRQCGFSNLLTAPQPKTLTHLQLAAVY